ILGYLDERFKNNQEELHIVDIASGAGHLRPTVKEVLPEIAVMHHLIEVGLVLSRVSVHIANLLEIPFDVYPQTDIML
ncbi:class I SAM-dependent methyltransferase, partial [Staphylococcus aureus]